MILTKPKQITQVNNVTCWAASMESWTGVTRKAAVPQAGLVPIYGDPALGGGLNSKLKALAGDYSLEITTVALNPGFAAPPYSLPSTVRQFTPGVVDELLETRG